MPPAQGQTLGKTKEKPQRQTDFGPRRRQRWRRRQGHLRRFSDARRSYSHRDRANLKEKPRRNHGSRQTLGHDGDGDGGRGTSDVSATLGGAIATGTGPNLRQSHGETTAAGRLLATTATVTATAAGALQTFQRRQREQVLSKSCNIR